MTRAPDPPPRRVVVAHPRTAAALAGRGGLGTGSPRPPAGPGDAGAGAAGEVLLRGLVRAQLLLSLRVAAAVACLLGGLPLLFAVSPGLRELRVAGIALPWLLLGALVYPVLLGAGWLHVRLAERTEREYLEAVERS